MASGPRPGGMPPCFAAASFPGVSIPLAPGPPALSLPPLPSRLCSSRHPSRLPPLTVEIPATLSVPLFSALTHLPGKFAQLFPHFPRPASQRTHLPHVPADTWAAPPSVCGGTSKCQGKSFPHTALNGPPWRLSGRESACRCRRPGFDPWVEKIPWRRKRQPTPVLSPGKSWTEEPGGLQSPGSERDTTERLNSSSKPPCPQPQRRCCSDPWSPVRTPGPHVPG